MGKLQQKIKDRDYIFKMIKKLKDMNMPKSNVYYFIQKRKFKG